MTVVPIYRLASRHPQAAVCAACEVRGAALFGVLDDEGLDRIHTRIASLELEADSLVYGRGSETTAMYTIRSGVVRFERYTERGDRRIVRLAGRGDLIGQESLLQRPYADEAIACTAVQLCRIPSALVDDLGDPRSGLLRELMSRWQQALDDAETWVAELSSGPARRRVLRLLVKLAMHADADDSIWLPRREEIGAMLDLTFETASRQVSRLRREGILELGVGRRARLDRDALHAAVRSEDNA
jgi:CRP/FNR family transcriptional regulator, anaerobic regulatory protein